MTPIEIKNHHPCPRLEDRFGIVVKSAIRGINRMFEEKVRDAFAQQGYVFDTEVDFINFADSCELLKEGNFYTLIIKEDRKKICTFSEIYRDNLTYGFQFAVYLNN